MGIHAIAEYGNRALSPFSHMAQRSPLDLACPVLRQSLLLSLTRLTTVASKDLRRNLITSGRLVGGSAEIQPLETWLKA